MKNMNSNLVLWAFLSSVSSFIYVWISPSICLCQPLSFSCISSTIFHYFSFSPSLSALIEAAAAGWVRRHLIRRLNQWCGPMANPSANKKKTKQKKDDYISPPPPPPPTLLIWFSIRRQQNVQPLIKEPNILQFIHQIQYQISRVAEDETRL